MSRYESELEDRIEYLEEKLESLLNWKDQCKIYHEIIYSTIFMITQQAEHDFISSKAKISMEHWMTLYQSIEKLKKIDTEIKDD